jgi:hypothetical protein
MTQKSKLDLSGKNNPMYGKHHSKSTKEKIRNRLKQSWTDQKKLQFSKRRKGKNNPFYGRKWSKEKLEELMQQSGKDIIPHHIYLKEYSEETVKVSQRVHSLLHMHAYRYLVEVYGKEEIDKYMQWFMDKGYQR